MKEFFIRSTPSEYQVYNGTSLFCKIEFDLKESRIRFNAFDNGVLEFFYPSSFFIREEVDVVFQDKGQEYLSKLVKVNVLIGRYTLFAKELGSSAALISLRTTVLKKEVSADKLKVAKVTGDIPGAKYGVCVYGDGDLSERDLLFIHAIVFYDYFVMAINEKF